MTSTRVLKLTILLVLALSATPLAAAEDATDENSGEGPLPCVVLDTTKVPPRFWVMTSGCSIFGLP